MIKIKAKTDWSRLQHKLFEAHDDLPRGHLPVPAGREQWDEAQRRRRSKVRKLHFAEVLLRQALAARTIDTECDLLLSAAAFIGEFNCHPAQIAASALERLADNLTRKQDRGDYAYEFDDNLLPEIAAIGIRLTRFHELQPEYRVTRARALLERHRSGELLGTAVEQTVRHYLDDLPGADAVLSILRNPSQGDRQKRLGLAIATLDRIAPVARAEVLDYADWTDEEASAWDRTMATPEGQAKINAALTRAIEAMNAAFPRSSKGVGDVHAH